MTNKWSLLDWAFVGLLLVIFGVVVLHAPLSVGLSTLWPDSSLIIKSWKEILLGASLLLCVVILTMRGKWGVIRSPILYLVAAFAGLNLLLLPVFYHGFEQTIAGLFINLRFLLFFALVFVAIKLYPQLHRWFVLVFFGGALVVLVFAILQVTVLPHDILKYLGYGDSTIVPYLTVDENMNYIRINSTLRGPNPLGIYAVITVTLVLAAWLRKPRKFTSREQVLMGILAGGSVVALWASYSRSALVAGLIAIGVVVLTIYGRYWKKLGAGLWVAIGTVALGLIMVGGYAVTQQSTLVSQVILHEDPNEGNDTNSNDGHIESLVDGMDRLVRQPIGAGVGSTGSASLLGDSPLIIENQYLFVAHETGWLGLGLFLAITYLVLAEAWRRRTWWLGLGVFASGVGIAVAGLVLPVWVDDTVSIIWWGLAAIACAVGSGVATKRVKARKNGRAIK